MGRSRAILVTGGTGYLGRPLVARLVERGHEVRCLVRGESVGQVPPGAGAIVEQPAQGTRIVDVPAIRAAAASLLTAYALAVAMATARRSGIPRRW